ncbi:UDP-N-acetylglucosamine 2-epimerase [Marinobacter sp. DS40M6]|uniref:UDP-N-acetylglucosamine 2-epimerase n=1 Tax=Marinobacter sp. DS40M6 TaxID=1597776 RepID=UPI002358DD8A|nr:UDP-N-acetylglucosamine 2-epimerase [Marinobacter sp. DS40M6]MDC8456142.1 UDP-N-acetylglucosamine 2-epimerase (hydrolyzing) [Marinobacter sp. DS40M6]
MKNILFVSGTRADFGKLKPLIERVREEKNLKYGIFATGMHLLSKYGSTINEIYKSGFSNVFQYMNQVEGEDMEVVLANTITGISRYLHENKVDLIVVHGDRVEALAGATVGALRNVLVAHVEGGEVSGTVDELMRHAISKLSHFHFVASDVAKKRLIQLGEDSDSIAVIGSPDVDVMLSKNLPKLNDSLSRYEIPFESYAIAILHPVTTDLASQRYHADQFVQALDKTGDRYIVIYPNNDQGSAFIFEAYQVIKENQKFRMFPSLRFEHFLTLLKNADYIVGNSSAGIHEAPIYGVPTINIGNRQHKRMQHESIFNTEFCVDSIVDTIRNAVLSAPFKRTNHYGDGRSADLFVDVLKCDLWQRPNQKHFRDLEFVHV